MGRRTDIDWPRIQIDYRLGIDSIRAIALKFGVAESNLRRRAKLESWTRDCAKSVHAARERAIAEDLKARAEEIGAEIGVELARRDRQVLVDVVLDGAQVIRAHKRHTRRAMSLAQDMLDELCQLTAALPALKDQISELSVVDPAKAALLERALGLKGRAETLDRIASASAKIAAVERQAHGLDREDPNKGNQVDELLKKVHAEMVANRK